MGIIKNEKGQMAIFIALFFQVLFVFFAMAINVGLVVHDKINLQNSVDMAAYYGAMKQAEVLNQIAHINYQMRQNYKLFVWRYRVLGTLGNREHPLMYANPAGSSGLRASEDSWKKSAPPTDQGVMPTVCVAHSFFQETIDLDASAASLCRENGLAIPAVPTISSPVGFVPGSGALPGIFSFIANQIAKFCREAGLMNWLYASRILHHLRTDGIVRKNMIGHLAGNLSGSNPLDLRGEPIEEGVDKTFRRNLTDTNLNGIQEFQYFNSLSQGSCADVKNWLVEIKINPVIFYSDWQSDTTSGACGSAESKPNRGGASNLPYAFSDPDFDSRKNATTELQDHWLQEPNDSNNRERGWHSSVGFEKNPWCMIYTGVRARTAIRKPFDPTGNGIILEARGFAKPFGGRIGPWYGKSWPQNSPNSQASSSNEMVDQLLPSRDVASGSSGTGDPEDDVANHSRFPGDQLGMSDMRALSAMIGQFMQQANHNSMSDPSATSVSTYDTLNGRTHLQQQTKDSLSREGATQAGPKQPFQRRFEIAAVAPDLFDALYYSIEPRYYSNYFRDTTTNNGAQFQEDEKLWDFGSTKDGASVLPDFGGGTTKNYSVIDQIALANGGKTYEPDYEYIIRDWKHLLTSWHQKGVVDFTMDDTKFGRCALDVDSANPDLPNPGNCVQGGRTGYSVKMISHDYLNSADHAVGGGSGGIAGPIQNPPSF